MSGAVAAELEVGAAPTAGAVARTTGVQVVSKALVFVFGIVSITVLTRYLGTETYGQLVLALGFTQALGVLADVGLATVVVRELAARPGRAAQIAGSALGLRLLFAVVVVALCGALSLLFPYPRELRIAIVLAGVPMTVGLATSAIVAVFQARLRMAPAALADVIGRGAGLAAALVVVVLDLGFYAVVASVAIGAGVTFLFDFVALRSRLGVVVRPRVDREQWRALLRAGIPIGVALAVGELYFRADAIIISVSRSFHEVGLYGLAYRVLELSAVVPGILLAAVFPVLAHAAELDPPRLRAALDTALSVVVRIGAPLAVGGAVLAAQIVVTAGGDSFYGAAVPLRILMAAAAVMFVNGLLGYALIARGRQVDALKLGLAGLVFNVGLNVLLVPDHGIRAAAWVMVGSELLILAGSLWILGRRLGMRPRAPMLGRALIASGVMGAVLWPVRFEHLALTLPLGIAAYGVALGLLGGLRRSELEGLRA
jgi:O-antigen/teichoic acid export membrane protein